LGTGTHSISGCLFQDNQAVKGGAISVEGAITSFTIDSSKFISNEASTFGGAIIIANQSN